MKRRLLSLLTLLSLLLCVAACALWVRSYWAPEEWSTAYKLPGKHLAGDYRTWERNRYVASSRGRLVFYDNDAPDSVDPRGARPRPPAGYRRGTFLGDIKPDAVGRGFGGATPKGRRSVSLAGFGYGFVPAQNVPAASPPLPVPGSPGTYYGDATFAGQRLIALPLWLPALLTAVLPAARAWRWHSRRASARRAGAGASPCPRCGYDLRASPDLCPECGSPASVSTGG